MWLAPELTFGNEAAYRSEEVASGGWLQRDNQDETKRQLR